jgi:AraC-like DNA-binding protein
MDGVGHYVVPLTRHVLRARDLIDRAYAEPLDVERLASAAGVSRAHFSRVFKEAYGETPYQYLMSRRIERAMAMLRAPARWPRTTAGRRTRSWSTVASSSPRSRPSASTASTPGSGTRSETRGG